MRATRSAILLVEDDRDIREGLAELLEQEGYTVTSAANGKEGLSALKEMEPPCLILLDLMMPVMNGLEFLEALEKERLQSKIPVVVVSAYHDMGRNLSGVAGFLGKPVDYDSLLKVVRTHC